MKTIDTLPEDIYALLQSQPKGTPEDTADKLSEYGSRSALILNKSLTERNRPRESKVLYASELGKKCQRQVWYMHNTPSLAEPLPSNTKFKFMYGDMIEEVVLTLAEQAGHEVAARQASVEFKADRGWTVRGRLDAIIDGVLVDVKSSSHYGMRKFAEGLTDANDSFGYRQQLSFYNGVRSPEYEQGFVVVDKQNGDIEYHASKWVSTDGIIATLSLAIEKAVEPNRLANAEEDAAFSNKKLCLECSYCPFKRVCWRNANAGAGLMLLTYASGPVWLTHVKKVPTVPHVMEPSMAVASTIILTACERNKT